MKSWDLLIYLLKKVKGSIRRIGLEMIENILWKMLIIEKSIMILDIIIIKYKNLLFIYSLKIW